ncbi:hypothetical protein KIN20_004192 [Parelaphostrongylus tenuis]|uniref:PDZ domain-containing protein n=1 Tax=Parelaphostrongylus tenuis TaxID=148309 RepID=A0AAD5M2P4_PARTN|nr:hypothetical protein KIN20_004192 [Parelaphostrongylus tenuis]
MQCVSDEGILDMDDKIIDVFDEIRDQILAIYDEQSPNGSDAVDTTVPRGPVVGRVRDSVVEIVSLDDPPSNGLRVSSSLAENRTPPENGTSFAVVGQKERLDYPVRSSLRSDTSTPSRHRVTLSPEVEKKLTSGEKNTGLSRSSARKSRLTDSFFDAKERLDDARQANRASPMSTRATRPRAYLKPALDPENTVLVFPDENLTPMGIEVTGVHDDLSTATNGRLSAVQILRIEPDGRVGLDGRLKVGDNIIEIDSRPVYQMSVVRARAYLSELQSRAEASLTVARPPASFCEVNDVGLLGSQPSTSSLHSRPILSALQQANTQHIGHTKIVNLKKTPAGFGFTVTGRETAKGERLFYIGTVKPNGVALGQLRAGDRLLELNGEPTADLTQAEVVDRLKKADVGETVSFLVSRVIEEDNEKKSGSTGPENQPPQASAPPVKKENEEKIVPSTSFISSQSNSEVEELELVIPLNETGSAGLGVGLKARVTVRTNGVREDCGIFIKNVLHGGAAHKDGRLKVNDRIVGIEELRLDGETNATASEAVSRRLKAIGLTAKYVRLLIHRTKGSPDGIRTGQSTSSVDELANGIESHPDDGKLDESDLANVTTGVFNREAPTRKSMSEKRGMGASTDPYHIKIFQDIKHQRETSAPNATMSTSLSFHGQTTVRSASQRSAARARSHSVHPRAPAPAPPKIMKMSAATPPESAPLNHLAASNPEKRRSLSVESISQDSQKTGLKKHAAMPYRGAFTADSFRQATDSFDNAAVQASRSHQYPPESQVVVKSRSTSRDKDKQRRKSLGGLTVMKSFLGFGGKNRDENSYSSQRTDTKSEEAAMRSKDEDERKKIHDHYERLREKEAEANRVHNPLTPSGTRREPPQRAYSSPSYKYNPSQAGISTSAPDYESYDLIDRYNMHRYPAEPPDKSGSQGVASYHRYVHPQPPPYHYAIPSSKTFHGSPIPIGCPPYKSFVEYGPEYRAQRTPSGRVPDYYRMFNSWFAYSGGVGGAPVIRAGYTSPVRRAAGVHSSVSPGLLVIMNTKHESNNPSAARLSLNTRKKFRRNVRSEVICQRDIFTPSPSFLAKCTTGKLSVPDRLAIKRSQSPDIYIQQTSPSYRQFNTPGSHQLSSPHSHHELQTLHTNSRVVTAIDDPGESELDHDFDHCRAWKHWNRHTCGSLPSRRSRHRPVLLNPRIYDGVTDC